jgi:signal transduction histidine kinase
MLRSLISGECEAYAIEHRYRRSDGTHVHGLATTWIADLAEGRHTCRLLQDVTEMKTAQLEMRKQSALVRLGTMAAVVAHEVRNPLAGVRGAIQVLGNRVSGPTEKAIVREVIDRLDSLNEMLRSLQEFARPEDIRPKHIRLTTLMEAVRATVESEASCANKTVVLDVSEGRIPVDPERFREAVAILLWHAAEVVRPESAIVVRASCKDTHCVIEIECEESDMNADWGRVAFAPSFKPGTRNPDLFSARNIIEAHGGNVAVESMDERGAIVRVTLPFREVHTHDGS